jgi:PilZ domain
MSAPPDLYRILHVQPDAPPAIIHASYRTLLQRAVGNGDETALLDLAYATLGDPQRRTAYDRERDSPRDAARGDAQAHDAAADPAGTPGTRNCLFCAVPHGLQRVLERDDECGHCGSPLFAAERYRFEYSGQRMLNRIPKRHGVDIWVTWPQAEPIRGEMRDLSLNGMQFVSAVRLQPNQVVRIDCSELRALGRIAHIDRDTEGGGLRAGVEFLTLRFRQVRGSFVSAKV